MRGLAAAAASSLALACGGGGGDVDSGQGDASADAGGQCTAHGPVELTVQTRDGLALLADFASPGTVGVGGVVLLHMIPPNNSKANFSPEFIGALVARGLAVININRRGAPGSEGVASEAYTGPNGVLDAVAGVEFLTGHACAVPPDNVAIIGASNGTTTATDYSVLAAGDDSLEQPTAMVFLSGGSYTENQSPIEENLAALSAHPILFAYPPGEAAWNEGVETIAPGDWVFTEYSPGAHGTGLLSSNPESVEDVAVFVDQHL